MILVGVMLGAVPTLLYGIRTGDRVRETISKAVASASFVLIGWLGWESGNPVATWLAVGLLLCAAGDMLLIPDRTFGLGLLAFLAGHVAYIVAFSLALPVTRWPVVHAVPWVVASVLVTRWLWPHLGSRRTSVTAYIVAITIMVWGAVAASLAGAISWTAAVGAGLFYLSDIAVARHRFVRPEFLNRALGLPAYYAGQLLIALSLATS
jgi:uncharacterized membrane protein YhhN